MGIFKRGNRWYIRFKVNGRDVKKSLGPKVKTKAQAENVFRKLQDERRRGRVGFLDPSKTTLADLRERFLTERKDYIADTSLERYRSTFAVLIRDLGEDYLLKHLTSRKISQWAGIRLSQRLSPVTVNSDLRHVKAILRRAAKWGMIASAPEIEFLRQGKRLPRHIPLEDLERLLRAETRPVQRRLWTFLLWTGLRRAEALQLTWQNVLIGPKPAVKVIGKGDKERSVPLLPPAREALGPLKNLGPVWPQVHPSTLSKWFRTVADSCGMDSRLHDLRHTCATFLLSRGVNIKAVQEILGHSDLRITQEYTKVFIGNLYDEMSKALD